MLVLATDRGLVVLTGCGRAGVVNILDYARKIVRPAPVHALLDGLHLYAAKEETLAWAAGKLWRPDRPAVAAAEEILRAARPAQRTPK